MTGFAVLQPPAGTSAATPLVLEARSTQTRRPALEEDIGGGAEEDAGEDVAKGAVDGEGHDEVVFGNEGIEVEGVEIKESKGDTRLEVDTEEGSESSSDEDTSDDCLT